MWVRSLGWEDPLEEDTATHSSVLAWRIPGTGEPGGLTSMVLQRVRHDWQSTHAQASQVALVIKNLPANAGEASHVNLIPRSGRFPGEGKSNPLQYSSLGNPNDRGAWWAKVHWAAKYQTQLSMHTDHTQIYGNLIHILYLTHTHRLVFKYRYDGSTQTNTM